ncbi:MAG TPA: SDR family NAD(P)-dependent oxidoreductase [Aggregatilineaceae bacterium]|nr:SDR family NAD(P)-dependent oxidoreductase [Aggregatilineaceae bacterium]
MLSGKVALITGGAGDLGNEMALHLAQAGADIVLWDVRNEADSRDQIGRVEATGKHVLYQQVDVRDRPAVDRAINELVERLGRIDIVCVNAGIVESAPFLEITPESWQRHLDINLTGAFHVAQSAARKMVALQIQGRILFTSTWVSEIPWPEITAYTSSKAGLNMLMKQAARELAPYGIRANAVLPGIVRAGLAGRQMEEDPAYAARVGKVIPLGEPGTAVEIADAIVYLASPQTAYMTGTLLRLDGGCSLFYIE